MLANITTETAPTMKNIFLLTHTAKLVSVWLSTLVAAATADVTMEEITAVLLDPDIEVADDLWDEEPRVVGTVLVVFGTITAFDPSTKSKFAITASESCTDIVASPDESTSTVWIVFDTTLGVPSEDFS